MAEHPTPAQNALIGSVQIEAVPETKNTKAERQWQDA
jgi:hypothetical protein